MFDPVKDSIGERGVYHARITDVLKNIGFTEIIPVTPELDLELRNRYMEVVFEREGRVFEKLESPSPSASQTPSPFHSGPRRASVPRTLCAPKGEASDCTARIYVAQSAFDGKLKEKYVPAAYETVLQVGCALTEKRIRSAACFDNTGENISGRNKQFCEMTGVYWIWKNAVEDIVGLAHYRRHFLLPEDWVHRMEKEEIDVILPVPLYVVPSLAENYRERHCAEDWELLMSLLMEKDPTYYENAAAFFDKGIYSPCNMFVMRKEVLDAYCMWVFPLLFFMADTIGEKEDAYQNRYPGFAAERLMSYFFDLHHDEYHVVYADKNFMG